MLRAAAALRTRTRRRSRYVAPLTQDDWDAEEEEKPKPAPKPAPKPVVKPGKAKKNLGKGAEINRRGVAGEETGLEDWDGPVDEAERRRREREAEMKSDLDNAAALLGGTNLSEPKEDTKPAVPVPTSGLASAQPSSKAEWEKYADDVYEGFIKPKAGRAGFDKNFFPHFLALLTSNGLRDVDMRKGSTKLREYAEAKVKADQELKRTGGNAKRPVANKPKQVGTSSAKNTYVFSLMQGRLGGVRRRSARRRRLYVVQSTGIQTHLLTTA